MFKLLEKENAGTIILGNKVRISDPCYSIDTWCAGTLEDVLEGKYNCYSQSADTGTWGIRIASIEVRHNDYTEVEPTEVQDIDVGVDSGQAGIYDLDYFIKAKEDKDGEDAWYQMICDGTYKYVDNPKYVPFEASEWWKDEFEAIQDIEDNSPLGNLSRTIALRKDIEGKELIPVEKEYIDKINSIPSDLYLKYHKAHNEYLYSIRSCNKIGKFAADTFDDKCLVSSSGDGDGSYVCLVGRNKDGKIVSIKIDYYYNWGEEDDEYED